MCVYVRKFSPGRSGGLVFPRTAAKDGHILADLGGYKNVLAMHPTAVALRVVKVVYCGFEAAGKQFIALTCGTAYCSGLPDCIFVCVLCEYY